jgi:hypothetical protein
MKQKQRTTEKPEEVSKDDDENCTFKPAITAWPGLENVSNMPVHERLYSNAFSRTQFRVPEDDLDQVVSASATQPVSVDGSVPSFVSVSLYVDGSSALVDCLGGRSRRYVQGGELYLI